MRSEQSCTTAHRRGNTKYCSRNLSRKQTTPRKERTPVDTNDGQHTSGRPRRSKQKPTTYSILRGGSGSPQSGNESPTVKPQREDTSPEIGDTLVPEGRIVDIRGHSVSTMERGMPTNQPVRLPKPILQLQGSNTKLRSMSILTTGTVRGDAGALSKTLCLIGWHKWQFKDSFRYPTYFETYARCQRPHCAMHQWRIVNRDRGRLW